MNAPHDHRSANLTSELKRSRCHARLYHKHLESQILPLHTCSGLLSATLQPIPHLPLLPIRPPRQLPQRCLPDQPPHLEPHIRAFLFVEPDFLPHDLVQAIVPEAHARRPDTICRAAAYDADWPIVGEGEAECAGHVGYLGNFGVFVLLGVGTGVVQSYTLVDVEAGVLACEEIVSRGNGPDLMSRYARCTC